MNVPTHEMDPRHARIQFQDYRKRVAINREVRKQRLTEAATKGRQVLYWARKERDQLALEDEELMGMYKALSQGKRVLALGEVFAETGMDKDHIPRMAIARADWRYVWFGFSYHETSYGKDRGIFYSSEPEHYTHLRKNSIYLPSSYFPTETTNEVWRKSTNQVKLPVQAMVPAIPTRLRPDRPEKFWLLWEAEWKKSVPEDPILLRRIGLYTFAVVAEWDLSPLERSVLYGRPS